MFARDNEALGPKLNGNDLKLLFSPQQKSANNLFKSTFAVFYSPETCLACYRSLLLRDVTFLNSSFYLDLSWKVLAVARFCSSTHHATTTCLMLINSLGVAVEGVLATPTPL